METTQNLDIPPSPPRNQACIDDVESSTEEVPETHETVQLPPELILQIIAIVDKLSSSWSRNFMDWTRTLLNLPMVSRDFYSLSMPFLLREVEVRTSLFYGRELPDMARKLTFFLQDGLGLLKFSYVKKLSLSIGRDSPAHMWPKLAALASKVGVVVQDLDLHFSLVPPREFWECFGHLPRLKRLTISTGAVDDQTGRIVPKWYDARASPYLDLLTVAEKCADLEYFELTSWVQNRYIQRRQVDIETWPQTLNKFPNLRRKLCELALASNDVRHWVGFSAAGLKKLTLMDFGEGYEDWLRLELFPDLEYLEVDSMSTSQLVLWPLRNLKKLHLTNTWLDLARRDLPIAESKFKEHQVELKMEVFAKDQSNWDVEEAWKKEAKFWISIGVKLTRIYEPEWPGNLAEIVDSDEEDDDEEFDDEDHEED